MTVSCRLAQGFTVQCLRVRHGQENSRRSSWPQS
jgi:hypothetical protein